MKKHKGKIIAGSIIILFHMLIGLYFWKDLADTMAVHWNAAGQPDGFASKLFAVVGMPLLLLALYWVCIFVTEKDKKNASQNDKVMALMLWIFPVISLIALADAVPPGTQRLGASFSVTAFLAYSSHPAKPQRPQLSPGSASRTFSSSSVCWPGNLRER